MSDLKQAALDLADEGFYIFPCKPGTKEPAIEGYRTARWTADQIEQWWARHPDDNIALCPDVNELVVLDLDLYKPECDWDRDVPETMMVRSASGGQHHYFEAGDHAFPGKFNGYSGVDIKHKGLVVLPPSRFANGAYEWGNDLPPAELPDWFPTRASVKVDPQAAALMSSGRGSDEGKLIELVHNSENQIEDREAWLAIGHALHFEYVGTEHEAEARWAWLDWSRRWDVPEADEADLEAAALKVWESAQTPEEVIASGRRPARGGTIRHHLRPKPPEAPEPPPMRGTSILRRAEEIDDTVTPWLVEGLIRVGGTHAVIGMSAVGKTALSAGFMAGMLAGRTEVYGLSPVERPLNVAWLNAEEPEVEMKKQLRAAQHKHGLPELGLPMFVGEEQLEREENGLEIVYERPNPATGRVEVMPNEPLIEMLINDLRATDIDLMMVDPITEFNGGDENSRFHARMLNRQFRRISQETGVAVMYWAHTGKPPENKRPDWYASDLYAQRGSSQNIGSVKGASTLTPLLPDTGSAADAWKAYERTKKGGGTRVVRFNTVKMKLAPTLYEGTYTIEPSELDPDFPVASYLPKAEAEEAVSTDKRAADNLTRSTQTQMLVRRLGVGIHSRGAVSRAVGGECGFPKDIRADRTESQKILQQWVRAQECRVDGRDYRVKARMAGANSAGFELVIGEADDG